jgi:hypothetical protein
MFNIEDSNAMQTAEKITLDNALPHPLSIYSSTSEYER